MKLMKKSFSMLLAVAMVFTATFGCMTVSSFAADSGTGSEGPKLVDYSLEVFNTDPKTEAGSEIKVALDFDKELKLTAYANNAFDILINNKSLSDMGFNNPVVSVDSEDNTKLILDLKGISHENVSDDWVYLVSGTIDISLKSNYYEDIIDTSGNQVSEWTDIHTMVPTGLEFTKKSHTDGAEGDGTEGSAVCESVTFDLTGDAKLRGASPIQILLLNDDNDLNEAIENTILAQEKIGDKTYGGQCNLARSTVNIHTHMYLKGSNATWANNLANNFYSKNYTMTADGASVTITAKEASDTQTLENTVIKMFGYDGPNDRYVQQTLFKNEISAAETRLASIDNEKVTAANKAALENAISEAKASYSAISDNTTAVEFNKARNSLRTAVTNAADNAITTSETSRNSGSVSLKVAGGNDWIEKITEISVDGTAVAEGEYSFKGTSLYINSSCFTKTTRANDYNITIRSEGYADVTKTIKVMYYGAQSFQIRYVDGNGKVIKSKTYSKDDIIKMSEDKDYYYNTACSMTGVRTFKARGVTLNQLLKDTGITFGPGMTEKIRTNDSVKGDKNDPTDENAYYERGSRTYEELMQKRYYFPDLFVPESDVAKIVSSERGVTDAVRKALGTSTTKVETEPMIAYEYVEKVYASDKTSLENDVYDANMNSDKCFRFLFGTAMDSADPTMAAKEVTTWSVSYNTFGIDIVDPNYKEPSSSKPSNSSSSTATPVTKYTVNKPADSAEGKVSVSPSSAEKGDTVTVTVTPADGYKTGNVTVTDKSGNKVSISGSDNKYTFKMPASNVTVKVTYEKTAAAEQPVQPITLPFKDVKTDRWSYSAIKYAYENKLFSGTSANEFSPADEMTRGMLVTVLYRLAGEPAVNGDAGFADIKSGDWYAKAVAWAKANNIVSGVSAAEFAPNKDITREQMAAILHRYAAYKSYSTAANGSIAGFNDNANVSAFAKDAVSWAVGEKLISGTGNNTLAPKGNATREQVAAILQRFAENIAK